MTGQTHWNYRPFAFFHQPEKALLPYVCRIAPHSGGFVFDWFDNGFDGGHTAVLRRRDDDAVLQTQALTGASGGFEGLEDGVDYAFTVLREGAEGSVTRLVRCGVFPDTVINYLHPDDPVYAFSGHSLCSPTLLKLPSGRLISMMDVFQGGGGQNLSLVFVSDDGGVTWKYLCELYPLFWPRTFLHRGKLYVIGVSSEYGDLVVGRSDDEGQTWTAPTHILPGTVLKCGCHKNPVPVVEHDGRVWTAVEYGSWAIGYHDMAVASFAVDDDPLDAGAWRISKFVHYDCSWPGAPVARDERSRGRAAGGIEGNVVPTPDGGLAAMFRMDIGWAVPNHGRSLVFAVDTKDPDAPLQFREIAEMPVGSNSKFTVRRHEGIGKYIAVGTEQEDDRVDRLVTAMYLSDDLKDWKRVTTLYDYRGEDPKYVGFQYPDWIPDGDDVLMATRVALNGAFNFHDANCTIFRRIPDVKKLTENV